MKIHISLFFLMILIMRYSISASQHGALDDVPSRKFTPEQIESQFLDQLDSLIKMLENSEKIEPIKTLSIAMRLESMGQVELHKFGTLRKDKKNPEEISRVVSEIISSNRYSRIEKASNRFFSSTDIDDQLCAIRLLSRTLSSHAAKKPLERKLAEQFEIKDYEADDDETNLITFAIAEGLAYLKSTNGVGVLDVAMRSDSAPARTVRAIRALASEAPDNHEWDGVTWNSAVKTRRGAK